MKITVLFSAVQYSITQISYILSGGSLSTIELTINLLSLNILRNNTILYNWIVNVLLKQFIITFDIKTVNHDIDLLTKFKSITYGNMLRIQLKKQFL